MGAPITIFVYRRPDHLRNTLMSLIQCQGFEGSPVIVYGDGPKNDQERESVDATRAVAQSLLGTRAEYHFSESNRGLSISVISGVTEVLRRFESVIVIEDDLELSPEFLAYMNNALDVYANDVKVFQVSGYMFDVQEMGRHDAAVFLPFTTSWGWATWRRAWQKFDTAAFGWEKLLTDPSLRRRFNLGGAYDYASMLERQMSGERDSWAIRWYWSVFKEHGLVLFPPQSLVRNTGFDGSGTHGRGLLSRFGRTGGRPPAVYFEFPQKSEFNFALYEQVTAALRRQNGGWKTACLNVIRRLIRR